MDGTEYMTTTEVAEHFRTTASTVRYWRHNGTGPPGARIGKRVLYRRGDVEAWARDHATAEAS